MQQALLTSVSPIPASLAPEMVAELQTNPPEWLKDGAWLEKTQQQLRWLLGAAPD